MYKYIIFLFLSLPIITGCSALLTTDDYTNMDSITINIVDSSVTSGISFNVPNASSYLFYTQSSRAFAVIDELEYKVYDSTTMDLVEEGSVYLEDSDDTTVSISLDPGTYSIDVEIYNYSNSNIEPVITASSSSDFTVTSGALTSVSLVGIPNSTELLTSGIGYSLDSDDFIPTYVDDIVYADEGTMEQWLYGDEYGSEKWFEFTPYTTYAALTMDITAGDYYSFFRCGIFNSDGTSYDYGTLNTTDYGISVIFNNLTPSETYYLCIVYLEYTSNGSIEIDVAETAISSATLTYEAYDITADEDNVDEENAFDISNFQEYYSGFNLTTDVDYFKQTLLSDKVYEFYTHSITGEMFDIEILDSSSTIINSSSTNSDYYYYSPENDEEIYIKMSNSAADEVLYSIVRSSWDIVELTSLPTSYTTLDVEEFIYHFIKVPVDPNTSYTIDWVASDEGYFDVFSQGEIFNESLLDSGEGDTAVSDSFTTGASDSYIIIYFEVAYSGTIDLQINEVI